MLDELEAFLQKLPNQRLIDREIYMLFSQVNEKYPGYDSFKNLKEHFNLTVTDFFIKLLGDYFVLKHINLPESVREEVLRKSPIPIHVMKFFDSQHEQRGSPTNYLREQLLFAQQNRGVITLPVSSRASSVSPYKNLGIVSPKYCPADIENYFDEPIEPAGRLYGPDKNEHSKVASWLRELKCPIISGASGSTETLCNRLMLVTSLSSADKYLIIFAQACNMVAHGHHSLFEAMIVAHHLGYPLEEKATLKQFYLQSVPAAILGSSEFEAFMESDAIAQLPLDISNRFPSDLRPNFVSDLESEEREEFTP